MKIFLALDFKTEEIKELLQELKNRSHEVVYLMGVKSREDEDFGETVFHDNMDAWHGRPALSLANEKFPPAGEDIISQMHRTESIVLTMMNRIKFGNYGNMCVDERKHCYYETLGYWHGVLMKYKPDVIVFPIVPHVLSEYVLYELALLLGIKIICFDDTWVSDRLLTHYDFWKGNDKVQEALKRNQGKKFTLDDLSQDLKNYYIEKTKAGDPFYMKEWKNRDRQATSLFFKLKILYRSLISLTIFKDAYWFLKSRIEGNIKSEYLNLQKEADLGKKYVYAPLHYQPEKTTSPLGGVFVDQILMVETLSYSLPEGWEIYVKEHPRQLSAAGTIGLNYNNQRYKGYYERLAKLKNVRLVPLSTDSLTLIKNSQAVATVCGTAGWEALLLSKPALVFGYPWYQDCPSILRVKDAASGREALQKIENGYKVDQADIINYLKSFDEGTIHCVLDNFFNIDDLKISALSGKEQKENYFNWILKEIDNIKLNTK